MRVVVLVLPLPPTCLTSKKLLLPKTCVAITSPLFPSLHNVPLYNAMIFENYFSGMFFANSIVMVPDIRDEFDMLNIAYFTIT